MVLIGHECPYIREDGGDWKLNKIEIRQQSLKLHRENRGKLEVKSKVNVKTKRDLALVYTPGVAEVCEEIRRDKTKIFDYTIKQNSIAVVTDGSAVLGLGNIGPEAALPVIEGKTILFKEFANIDAFPICLNTQNVDEIVNIVKNIAPTFGAIHLEDISAPRCFEIEERLQDIGIPVMHDDQHGTAIVVLAALINAAEVVGKEFEELKIVVCGAGAAGVAITRLLLCSGFNQEICTPIKEIILCDSKGIIHKGRQDLNKYKYELSKITNTENRTGSLADAIKDMDVFIGVSTANILTKDMIKTMAEKPIIFVTANPIPEIMPEEALEVAEIVATGRSDYPNQVNNVLSFPGFFRGLLDARAKRVNNDMKLAAAYALAKCVKPRKDKIVPSPFDKNVVRSVSDAVKEVAIEGNAI